MNKNEGTELTLKQQRFAAEVWCGLEFYWCIHRAGYNRRGNSGDAGGLDEKAVRNFILDSVILPSELTQASHRMEFHTDTVLDHWLCGRK